MRHEIEIEDLQLPDFTLDISYNADGEITLPANWRDLLHAHVMAHFPLLCKMVTDKQNDLEFWNYPQKWAAEAKGANQRQDAEDNG